MPPRSPVFAFSSQLCEDVARLSPVLGSIYGVGGPHTGWDDLSPSGTAAMDDLFRSARRTLATLEASDRWDQLAIDVIGDVCEAEIDKVAHHEHHFDLNSIASNLQTPGVVLETTTFGTDEDVRIFVERLGGLAAFFDGYIARLTDGLENGNVVARRQVLAGIEQANQHAAPGSLVDTTAKKAAQASPQHADPLEDAASTARQAYAALADWLEKTYLPNAPTRDAVGPERYARAARHHLGMAVDPDDLDEAVAWGWSEVRRIEARMDELARQIRPGASPADAIALLREDPAWCDPDTASFLERMRRLQHDAVDHLHGTAFDVPEPVRAIDVMLAPPGGPLGAYYRGPNEDFSRPGAVSYRLAEPSDAGIPWFHEVSTAYHEGFPGHHLQIATMVHQAEQLSRFQRLFAHYTGHAEGWALYAERLMLELGAFDHPALELGHLINELARAYRVVVDIGLHLELSIPDDFDLHPGQTWTYDLAVEVMRDRAMLTGPTAIGNVVRYLGWPGQAITYKLGQRVMLEARETLKQRPGFTLAGFHASVLEGGSIGLGRLKSLLDV